MLGLARWIGWTRNGTTRRTAKRRPLYVEMLEDRVVPTLLGQQLFPGDYPWNQNIANAPVASNSAAVIANIGSNIGIHADWGEDSPANGNDPLYGIPVNIVHGNTAPKVTFVIDDYPGESDLIQVPMPANPRIEGDYQNGPNPNGPGYEDGQRGDSHLLIWDVDNNIAYELYGVARPNDPVTLAGGSPGGVWHAAQQSVWNMNANSFRTLGDTSADAAGLSLLAGLVRPDEGLPTNLGGQGAINHALRFTLPSSKILPQYIYPASHVVNVSSGANKLPFGARLRLKNTPAVNTIISTLGPQAQIIAHAMQQYGLVLADIGSSMYVTGTSSSPTVNNTIGLTWDMDDALGLSALKAGSFDVVDLTPRVTGLSATTASAGSSVTVIGQNFSGSAGRLAVLFGNVAATTVTYVDDSHINAVVPFGSGTVYVTVRSGVVNADPNSPNHNFTNPVFGYGTSTVTAAAQFNHGSGTGAGSTTFSDSFTTAGGNQQLPGTWTNQLGGFKVNTTAQTATGVNALNLATVNTVSNANESVSAVVTVATKQMAGLVVRHVGPGDRNMYYGAVVGGTGTYTAYIYRNLNGVWKKLFMATIKGTVKNATLEFDAIGSSLRLFLNGKIIAYANDTSLTAAGAVGMRGARGAITKNFSAGPLSLANASSPFSDNFNAAGANGQLSSSWFNQVGNIQVTGGAARGVGKLNMATVNGINAANVSVQTDVTVSAIGQAAGLVARYGGSGEKNMYFAAISQSGAGTFKATFYVNVNGVWTVLKSQAVSAGTGTLRLIISGNSLTITYRGSTLFTIMNSALTGAGAVGLRLTAGASADNFSMS